MPHYFIKYIKQGNWIHKMYFEKYKCSANRGSIRIMIIVMSFSLAMVCEFVALSNLFIVYIDLVEPANCFPPNPFSLSSLLMELWVFVPWQCSQIKTAFPIRLSDWGWAHDTKLHISRNHWVSFHEWTLKSGRGWTVSFFFFPPPSFTFGLSECRHNGWDWSVLWPQGQWQDTHKDFIPNILESINQSPKYLVLNLVLWKKKKKKSLICVRHYYMDFLLCAVKLNP